MFINFFCSEQQEFQFRRLLSRLPQCINFLRICHNLPLSTPMCLYINTRPLFKMTVINSPLNEEKPSKTDITLGTSRLYAPFIRHCTSVPPSLGASSLLLLRHNVPKALCIYRTILLCQQFNKYSQFIHSNWPKASSATFRFIAQTCIQDVSRNGDILQ